MHAIVELLFFFSGWKTPSFYFGLFDYKVVCAKVREGDKRIVRIKEGNPEGRHVVIVDDLVQSGGTLRECQVSTYCLWLCYDTTK